MNYYLNTEHGEIGPFPMVKINRMFRAGEIRGDHLCRPENSQEKQPLDVMFKHFAPSQDVVASARKNVAAYNTSEGNSSMLIGLALIVLPAMRAFLKDSNLLGLIPWLIVGIGLLLRGYAQNARGVKDMEKLAPPPTPPTPPTPPKNAQESKKSGGLEY